MSESEKHAQSPRRWYQSIWLWLVAALLSIILMTWGIVGIQACPAAA